MAADTARIIERVLKILALGNSPNTAEAELAMMRVHEMLHRHNLTLQDVERHQAAAQYERLVLYQGRMPREAHFVLRILKTHFHVEVVVGSLRGGKRIWLLGRPDNLQAAQHVYLFLLAELRRQWAAYRQSTGAKEKARLSFYFGITDGLCGKLAAQKQCLEAQTALVLQADVRLTVFVGEQFDNLQRGKHGVRVRSRAAHHAGFAVGQHIQIRPAISPRRPRGDS